MMNNPLPVRKKITRQAAFTLLEVMIALAIAGIVSAGMYNVQTSQVRQLRHLENKTLAHWVAMNKLVEFQYFEALPNGKKFYDAKMADLEWEIECTVIKTEFDSVKRVEIAVGLKAEKREKFQSLTTLVSLVGQPALSGKIIP